MDSDYCMQISNYNVIHGMDIIIITIILGAAKLYIRPSVGGGGVPPEIKKY